MTAIHKTNILFDDFAMLNQLIGKDELLLSPPNTNCDCTSYSSTADNQDVDTDQVTPSAGQAH